MSNWVAVGDIPMFWRALTADEEPKIASLIVVAEDIISAQWPIQDWINRGLVQLETVRWAVAMMIKAAHENAEHDGLTSELKTAGPFQHQQAYASPPESLRVPLAVFKQFEKIAEKDNGGGVTQRWLI